MKHLSQMWCITVKDVKIFVKDRASVFFFLIFPFMFVVLFYFLNIGQSEDNRLELHLATQEPEGGLSYMVIGAMETKDESVLDPGAPVIVWDRDYDAAYQAVKAGELSGFIAFPAGFTEAVYSGSGTQLQVVADAGDVNTGAILNSVAGTIASEFGTYRVIVSASIALMLQNGLLPPDEASIDRAVQQIMADIFAAQAMGSLQAADISIEVEKIGEIEGWNPADYVIPGYLVMFVFFAAASSAEIIVRERQNHTLERLLASSVKWEVILGGIFTGMLFKGLIQIIIFWVAGILIFKIDLGLAPAAVIILSMLMVIMSAAFAVMLATLVRTQRAAGSLATLTALLLAPLGGCWWPLFILPRWLQNIAKISPHAWANEGFNKLMLFGADFNAVIPDMLALVGFAVVFGIIAVWRFRTSAV